jgi:hypothetical protein
MNIPEYVSVKETPARLLEKYNHKITYSGLHYLIHKGYPITPPMKLQNKKIKLFDIDLLYKELKSFSLVCLELRFARRFPKEIPNFTSEEKSIKWIKPDENK